MKNENNIIEPYENALLYLRVCITFQFLNKFSIIVEISNTINPSNNVKPHESFIKSGLLKAIIESNTTIVIVVNPV